MAQLYFSYKYVFLDLDKTFIEMSNTSHLPVSQPDNEKEFLHETQLVVLDSAGTRSSNLNTIKVVAYVSGKGSLYTVSKWMSYVRYKTFILNRNVVWKGQWIICFIISRSIFRDVFLLIRTVIFKTKTNYAAESSLLGEKWKYMKLEQVTWTMYWKGAQHIYQNDAIYVAEYESLTFYHYF